VMDETGVDLADTTIQLGTTSMQLCEITMLRLNTTKTTRISVLQGRTIDGTLLTLIDSH